MNEVRHLLEKQSHRISESIVPGLVKYQSRLVESGKG
jgi:hypothetical protein